MFFRVQSAGTMIVRWPDFDTLSVSFSGICCFTNGFPSSVSVEVENVLRGPPTGSILW